LRTYKGYKKQGKINILEGDSKMSEFNPTKTEKTVITIRIETDLLREIDDLSGSADISRNEFILQCIDFAMKHYPKAKND